MRKLAITVSAIAMVAAFGCKSRTDYNKTDINRDKTMEPSGRGGGPEPTSPATEDYRTGAGGGDVYNTPSGGLNEPSGTMGTGGTGMGSTSDEKMESAKDAGGSIMEKGKDAGGKIFGGKDGGMSGTGSYGGGPNMGGMDESPESMGGDAGK